jgi:hypothetical protein
MIVTTGGTSMTDGKKTIQVTEEEFEYLIKLRQELQRRETTGEETPEPLGGSKSSEFAMGTVAGIAAYWLYKELLDDDEEFDDDEPIEVVKEIRPIAVVKKDPRRRYRQ